MAKKSDVKDMPTETDSLSPEDLLQRAISTTEEDILPWEDIQLPSEGIYYGNLMPGGMVKARPMNIHAEKMMATQRFAKSGKSIDMMFKQCVKLPDEFDTLDLLAGDRVFLLYYIRGITHGPNYEFMLTCPNEGCADTSTYEYNLVDLYKTVKKPSPDIGEEPFKLILPNMTKVLKQDFWVRVKFMRGRDMQRIMQQRTFDRKLTGGQVSRPGHRMETIDQTLEDNINMVIADVMGSTNSVKIKQIVSKMHSKDIATIREFIKDHSPGIDTNIKVTCTGCGNEYSVDLPITESFFRPSHARGDGERVESLDGATVSAV